MNVSVDAVRRHLDVDAMDRITCPTPVLAGAQEPATPIEVSEDIEDMAAWVDRSIVTYVPLENAGRGVRHDDPDRASAVLRDLIPATGPAS